MNDLGTFGLFLQVDLLTGCSNLVSFSKALGKHFDNDRLEPWSLVVVDIYQMHDINHSKGYEFGDSVLRWIGIAIKDVTGSTVYRISGDNFAAALIGQSHEAHQETARKLLERLNGEARQLALTPPVVRMAVIHFPAGLQLPPPVVWKNLNELLEQTTLEHPMQVFQAEISAQDDTTLKAIELMAKRLEDLGAMLQHTFRLAYTDPVSLTPNMLAIQRKLELSLSEGMLQGESLSICLLDGDNLKRYNNSSYAAGDEVVRKIGTTLSQSLRPDDFLGRWRMGDEYIVILPATNLEQAAAIAERLRASVELASQEWLYPTSVSVGVAQYPRHGCTAGEILATAEVALAASKRNGKNQVTVAP
jgi:diguanylate cyclase (GGDEF)-like protein